MNEIRRKTQGSTLSVEIFVVERSAKRVKGIRWMKIEVEVNQTSIQMSGVIIATRKGISKSIVDN